MSLHDRWLFSAAPCVLLRPHMHLSWNDIQLTDEQKAEITDEIKHLARTKAKATPLVRVFDHDTWHARTFSADDPETVPKPKEVLGYAASPSMVNRYDLKSEDVKQNPIQFRSKTSKPFYMSPPTKRSVCHMPSQRPVHGLYSKTNSRAVSAGEFIAETAIHNVLARSTRELPLGPPPPRRPITNAMDCGDGRVGIKTEPEDDSTHTVRELTHTVRARRKAKLPPRKQQHRLRPRHSKIKIIRTRRFLHRSSKPVSSITTTEPETTESDTH